MRPLMKYLSISFICLILIVLSIGFLALSQPYIKGLSDSSQFNKSNETDLIVAVNEDFINSIIQLELNDRQPEGIENITLFFNEGGPVEVLVELELPMGVITVRPQVKVNADIMAANDTLKIMPTEISVGKLNIPEIVWRGPVNSALAMAETASNQAIVSNLQKGFKIASVHIGERYLILTINAPPPEDLKKAMRGG